MIISSLVLKTRMENFATELLPSLKNFPKFERHGMVAEIRVMVIKMITSIQLAERVKSKRLAFAQESDGYLEAIFSILRICKHRDFRYISNGFYMNLYKKYKEIKKEMVSFIKDSVKK